MGEGNLEQTHCPTCESEQRIKKTVPWQVDFCATCGTDSVFLTVAGVPSHTTGSEDLERACCPTCETEGRIRKTVPWQANFCARCGTDFN